MAGPYLLVVEPMEQGVDDGSCAKQVTNRTECLRLVALLIPRLQVGPGGRDQALAAVRQDQEQIELAVAAHPSQQRQLPALERVMRAEDADR